MIITVDHKIYRQVSVAGGRFKLGEWEILFNGKWSPVRNWNIRKKLDDFLKSNFKTK